METLEQLAARIRLQTHAPKLLDELEKLLPLLDRVARHGWLDAIDAARSIRAEIEKAKNG